MGKGLCLSPKLNHSKCNGTETVQVFQQEDGSKNGFCFKCGTWFSNEQLEEHGVSFTEPRAKKSPEEIKRELLSVQELPFTAYRGISLESAKAFGIRSSLSEEDGETVIVRHYPYTRDLEDNGYRNKIVQNKQFYVSGELSGCDLFNLRNALAHRGYKFFITEGEEDAASLRDILQKHASGGFKEPAITSLPYGATGSQSALQRALPRIKAAGFKDVVLVFDQDEAGKAAEQIAQKVFNDSGLNVLIARFSEKDANDMLQKGKTAELFQSVIYNAQKPLTGKMVKASDLWQKAASIPKRGVDWPWQGMTALTRGIRTKEGYYIGAGTKMG